MGKTYRKSQGKNRKSLKNPEIQGRYRRASKILRSASKNLHTLSLLSAVPDNRLVILGSYEIVPSPKTCLMLDMASVLIAGVIVVMVDWKSVLRRAKS